MKMIRNTSSILMGAVTLAAAVFAQTAERMIPAGTIVQVRTNQTIDSRSAAPGQVFTGVVAHNVADRAGRVVIAGGAPAELVVRNVSKHKMLLDLQAIVIAGQRYHVLSDTATVEGTNKKNGLGANKRTAKFVGGGALGGSVIGAIAGGGAGAAIGAFAGGAGGATAQVLTKGKAVQVPAESLVTFRLTHAFHT